MKYLLEFENKKYSTYDFIETFYKLGLQKGVGGKIKFPFGKIKLP